MEPWFSSKDTCSAISCIQFKHWNKDTSLVRTNHLVSRLERFPTIIALFILSVVEHDIYVRVYEELLWVRVWYDFHPLVVLYPALLPLYLPVCVYSSIRSLSPSPPLPPTPPSLLLPACSVQGGSAEIQLKQGDRVKFSTDKRYYDCGDNETIYVDYVNIVNTTAVRDLIFIDDGLISVMVVEKGVDYLLTGLKRVSVSRESGIEISKLEPRGINARLKAHSQTIRRHPRRHLVFHF